MRARGALFAGVAVMAARLSATGCDDAGAHVYVGEEYYPTIDCVGPLTGVDTVTGPEPMTPCRPVCILSLPADGGQIAYVSSMCAPYPVYPYETDASTDPLCVAAVAAFKRGAVCVDGAAPPGDASIDASVDAGQNVPDALPSSDAAIDVIAD